MKIIYLTTLAILLSVTLFGQEVDTVAVQEQKDETQIVKPKLDRSRIYYGGYVTLNFSKNYSVLGAQPMVGYKLTPKLSVGAQLSYEYINNNRYSFKQNGSNYGFSIFNRIRVTPRLYSHVEFSMMSYKWFYSNGSEERKLVPLFYVGGGYSQPISENVWLNAQVLFDVLNNENSPYKDWKPYFSMGIGVGF